MNKKRRFHLCLGAIALLAGLAVVPTLKAASPSWWVSRGVLNTNASPNDFAAVNQGQVKNFASNAYMEMQANLPGGAGSSIAALINSFSPTNNYLPANIGQLKYVAKPFYDRLIAVGYTTNYPWVGSSTTNDYALANIGQLKNLFNWDITKDSVGDGIPDWWRQHYFGGSGTTTDNTSCATCDADSDGWSNLEEYLNNTNPQQYDGTLDSFDFTVNDGHTYSPTLTVAIQPQATNYPNILVSFDPLMTNATALANSGGPINYTLPDNGDGVYELFLQYADAQGLPHGPILSKSVILDRAPPVVYITSPASTAVLDQAFITLQAVAADPDPVLPDAARPLSIWINGQPYWDREGTNIVVDLFPVPAGTNSFTVTIQVADQAGHTNQASQTWRVDTSGVTNAPTLLSVNLSSTMLLPDVDSIWVEGDVDNGKARVSALVNSGSGDVSTNALNVWKQHYEGSVSLESGTNQVVLLASDAAGNTSSMSFTIIRSTRYQAVITSPTFGDFATAPSNTVSGYVSAVFDAGLPTQTNVLGVTINDVAAVLGTNIDADGNVPFTTTNMIPLGLPITGYLVGDGLPTDPPPSIPPAMSQVYEVTHKVEVNDDFVAEPQPSIVTAVRPADVQPSESIDYFFWNVIRFQNDSCWYPYMYRQIITVTQDWEEAASQVQANWSEAEGSRLGGPCLSTFDPNLIPWDMYEPYTTSYTVAGPIDRGLSFGTYSYDHGEGIRHDSMVCPSPYYYYEDTEYYRTLQRNLDTGTIRFRAPRQYGTNTTVIFTFEGVDYRRRDGVPLDLSQIQFRGQSPVAYSNETQTVSYLLTVDGGKEYTIIEGDFKWPADQQLHHVTQSWDEWDPCYSTGSFAGDWTEDMHWLMWTNFHDRKVELDVNGRWAIPAKTAWPDAPAALTNASVLQVTVLTEPGTENLVTLEIESPPTENGTLTHCSTNNALWFYEAFSEDQTQKHPAPKRVSLAAKINGTKVASTRIWVMPVFSHLSNPMLSVYAEDREHAWRYARWKYNIDTSNLASIAYNPITPTSGPCAGGDACTSAFNNTQLYPGAFSSENCCASTLGHENVHGGQDPLFRAYYPHCAELEAYNWELNNATATGLSAEEIADVQTHFNTEAAQCNP